MMKNELALLYVNKPSINEFMEVTHNEYTLVNTIEVKLVQSKTETGISYIAFTNSNEVEVDMLIELNGRKFLIDDIEPLRRTLLYLKEVN